MFIKYIYWELSNYCNLQCRQCFAGATRDITTIINQATLYQAIANAKEFGPIAIRFGGGEPLLVPYLVDLIKHCTNQEIPVDITSNALLLNESIIQKLSEAGLRELTVSIDGLEETHDFFRGRGSFRRIENNLLLFPNPLPFELSVGFTVTARNYREITVFVEHFHSIGIRKFYFFRYCGENCRDMLQLNMEQLANASAIIRNLSVLYPDAKFIRESLSFFMFPALNGHCSEGCNFLKGILTVNYKGDVVVCAAIPKIIGNIYKEDSEYLKRRIEKEMLLIKQIPIECSNCKYQVICHGGCKEYSYWSSGDYSRRDPLCPLA